MAQDVDGRRIAGRYELGAQLGEGGVGIVWRAEDTLLGRPVAIKEVELPPAVRDQQRAALRARVIREARAAARLSHPGAVTLFDVVQDGGQDYIIMELVEGPTLDQLVAGQGPLPPQRAAMLGLRLLATLEAAHRAGIVHRDVKPSNVLVRDDGTTKLTDFGTASLTGDPELTVTGVVVGSPAYMAPEQIRGLDVGPATDLWALGATLYFAVEGEPPFKSSTTQFEVLNAIVNDPPRRARRLGVLGPVIDRLLRKDPDQRPASADVWYQLRRVAATTDAADDASAGEPARQPSALRRERASAEGRSRPLRPTRPQASPPDGPAEQRSAGPPSRATPEPTPTPGTAPTSSRPPAARASVPPPATPSLTSSPGAPSAVPDAAAAGAPPAIPAAATGTGAPPVPGAGPAPEAGSGREAGAGTARDAGTGTGPLPADDPPEGTTAASGGAPGGAAEAGAAEAGVTAPDAAPPSSEQAGGGAWLRRRWRRSGS
jgi:serine/threonine protein kinase